MYGGVRCSGQVGTLPVLHGQHGKQVGHTPHTRPVGGDTSQSIKQR